MCLCVAVGLELALATGCSDGRTGTIRPKLEVGAPRLDFGKVLVGAPAAKGLSVVSASNVALDLAAATIEGDAAGAFRVVAFPTSLGPQGSGRIDLEFTPPALGDFAATLVLATTDPDSPARVALAGRGSVPKLRVVPECRAPCSGFAVADDPPAIDFGARRPSRSGSADPAWPTVTLLNEGELPVTIESITLQGDAAFGTSQSLAATGFPIAPGAGQSVHVTFEPVTARAQYAATLVVESQDPAHPRIEVALTGALAPPPAPTVCAALVEAQGPDGSISKPRDGEGNPAFDGAQPPVQPGKTASVTFSANSDRFLAQPDATRCTTSPETGRVGMRYAWSVVERPIESRAALGGEATAEPTMKIDAIGRYRVRLVATDANGQTGSAEVAFDAWPRRDLVAQLSWKEVGVDLDLHLVRPGASCGGSCVFDPSGDLNGYSALTGTFDWGQTGLEDDPRLDRDDQGTQGGIETVSLDKPEHDPACASGTCTYGLYVHYYADGRSGSGSAPACPAIPCLEGQACGCAQGTSCVAAHCVSPARPSVAVYVKPAPGRPPSVFPVPGEDFAIAGACFLWHVADVVWKSDGTGEVVAVGAAGSRELGYFGKMDPGSFACSPNQDPGLPAGYRQGTIPEYR